MSTLAFGMFCQCSNRVKGTHFYIQLGTCNTFCGGRGGSAHRHLIWNNLSVYYDRPNIELRSHPMKIIQGDTLASSTAFWFLFALEEHVKMCVRVCHRREKYFCFHSFCFVLFFIQPASYILRRVI